MEEHCKRSMPSSCPRASICPTFSTHVSVSACVGWQVATVQFQMCFKACRVGKSVIHGLIMLQLCMTSSARQSSEWGKGG